MSIAITRATRPSLAMVVLLALFTLGSRSVEDRPVPRVAAVPEAGTARPGPRRNWALDVDGWRIEIDGVFVERTAFAPPAEPAMDLGQIGLSGLARYADSIGRHAAAAGLDWRLVAAVIAEESGFDANALSPAGAFGLMQVMPGAARDVGVFPYRDADANIEAGVRYLASMREQFSGGTERDHIAMMLAAYNMGPGHLRDALALADGLGYPTHRWDDSVAAVVLLLEKPEVYRELRHGYAQARQVVRYVERVLSRHGEYRRRFPGVLSPAALVRGVVASR
jgi:soluble lytic murein transglycosylase-like protein